MRKTGGNKKLFLFAYFLILIFVGSVLLSLPEAWDGRGHLRYIDALFTSTSAVCVTGLITVQTPDFSLFGQIVILLLIQFGGLGIISFTTLYLAIPARRMSLRDRDAVREYYIDSMRSDPKGIIKKIVLMTLFFEILGTILLFKPFSRGNPFFGQNKIFFLSLFHSVSAFCNAGFSLFRNSLESYRDSVSVNMVIMFLIVFGGLGFVVLQDVSERILGFRRKISLHTKIVLSVTGVLIVGGAILYYLLEAKNTFSGLTTGSKVLASLFQSVTTRTAGFNTVEESALTIPSKTLTLFLMFVGGSSGSIAGGIKVTTFFIVLLVSLREPDSRNELEVFKMKISQRTISKALSFTLKAILILFVSIFLLTVSELLLAKGNPNGVYRNGRGFLALVFEAFSAFGTVGLSMGVTSHLSIMGKVVIILTMFSGRVGLISIAMPKYKKYPEHLVDYPRGEVLIG